MSGGYEYVDGTRCGQRVRITKDGDWLHAKDTGVISRACYDKDRGWYEVVMDGTGETVSVEPRYIMGLTNDWHDLNVNLSDKTRQQFMDHVQQFNRDFPEKHQYGYISQPLECVPLWTGGLLLLMACGADSEHVETFMVPKGEWSRKGSPA